MQGTTKTSDIAVWTLPLVSAEVGSSAELACDYAHDVQTMYWSKQNQSGYFERIVTLENYLNNGSRTGLGYETGRFEVTNNFSLVINNVKYEDEGRYLCEVLDVATGHVFGNHTDVTVTGKNINLLKSPVA